VSDLVSVWCPDCNTQLSENEYRECYCWRCNATFSEDEVRERCGI
jgi:leucyl-tRNA synthetase